MVARRQDNGAAASVAGSRAMKDLRPGPECTRHWLQEKDVRRVIGDRLRDVRVAYLGRAALPVSESSSLDLLLARLPAPWRLAVTCASPASPAWHTLTPAGQLPAVLDGPDPMSGAFALWELCPSGLLQRLSLGTPRPAGPPGPALVVPRPKPKYAWLHADYHFDEAQRALPRDEMQFHPRVWSVTLPSEVTVDMLHMQGTHGASSCAVL